MSFVRTVTTDEPDPNNASPAPPSFSVGLFSSIVTNLKSVVPKPARKAYSTIVLFYHAELLIVFHIIAGAMLTCMLPLWTPCAPKACVVPLVTLASIVCRRHFVMRIALSIVIPLVVGGIAFVILSAVPFPPLSVSTPAASRFNETSAPDYVPEDSELHGLAPSLMSDVDPTVSARIPYVREALVHAYQGTSIVIPARFEADYMVKTIMYVFYYTPPALLREIVVVDDQSEVPLEDLIVAAYDGKLNFLNSHERQKIRVLRMPERVGLIKAKIVGADASRGSHILFLDGHCRPVPGYLERMILKLGDHYKRIVAPVVTDVDGDSWEHKSYHGGVKMMFRWNFEFDWFDDGDDYIPVTSGGILLLTKRWWREGGGYDSGMLEWGAENIEQSMRSWMCGGDIVVERRAKIGHIFARPAPPNKVTGATVQRNHARAAFVWLDEYLPWFNDNHPIARAEMHRMGERLGERLSVRHRLQCDSFKKGFLDRFSSVFASRGMLLDSFGTISHQTSGLCLTALRLDRDTSVSDDNPPVLDEHAKVEMLWVTCTQGDPSQQFTTSHGGNRIYSPVFRRCMDRGNRPFGREKPILFHCDSNSNNDNQRWYMRSGRIFSMNSELKDSGGGLRNAVPQEERADALCLVGPDAGTEISQEKQEVFMEPCRRREESKPFWLHSQAFESAWSNFLDVNEGHAI